MYIRVGINGFGRIGRIVLRACLQNPDLQVAAINDPALDVEYICYLIKFDSTHGKLEGSIVQRKNEILINDDIIIRVYNEKSPPDIPWHLAGVNYVVESSGMFTTMEKASMYQIEAVLWKLKDVKHKDKQCIYDAWVRISEQIGIPVTELKKKRDALMAIVAIKERLLPLFSLEQFMGHLINDCVKQVIVTAPSIDIPMIIIGVNDEKLTPDLKILSAGSSTLYCLAPMIKILEDKYGVAEGFVTSIHAMTPSMKPLDGLCLRGKHWRDHRSAVQNIIPAATGACKALGKIIPQAKDKLTGLAFRVPVVNVSVLDLTVKLTTPTSLEMIAKEVEEAGRSFLKRIIKVSKEEAVSSDFMKDSHSCILDLDASLQLRPTSFKLICWYENEYSYACRVLDYMIINETKTKLGTRAVNSCYLKVTKSESSSSFSQYFKGDAKGNVSTLTNKISVFRIPEVARNKFFPKKMPMEVNAKKDDILETMIFNKVVTNKTQDLNKQVTQFLKKTRSLSVAACTRKKDILPPWPDIKEPKKNKNVHEFGSKYTQNLDSVRPHQENLQKIKQHFNRVANITEALMKKSCSHESQCTSKTSEVLSAIVSKSASQGASSSLGDAKYTKESSEITSKEDQFKKIIKSENDVPDKRIPEVVIDDCKKKEDNETTVAEVESQVLCVTNFDSIEPVQDTIRVSTPNNDIIDELITVQESNTNKSSITKLSENENYCIESLSSESSKQDTNSSSKRDIDSPIAFKTKDNSVQIVSTDLKLQPTTDSTSGVLDCGNAKNIPNKINYFLNPIMKVDVEHAVNKEDTHFNIDLDNCPFLDMKTKNVMKRSNDVMDKINYMQIDQSLENPPRNNLLLLPNNTSQREINMAGPSNLHLFPKLENTDPSQCPSEQLLTRSSKGEVFEDKPDIYDKLDSKSVSDASENSFQICEKKSQVLKLSDVTKSLEELDRIDKICRIIEISDDLSDQLFSSLENDVSDVNVGNMWSFNDMCQRIKLEEFYDKRFGGNNPSKP